MKNKRREGGTGGCKCAALRRVWLGAVVCVTCGRALSPEQRVEVAKELAAEQAREMAEGE